MTRPGRYPQELRERAVRLVLEHQHEHPSQWAAICSIAHKFGVSTETLRKWVHRAETDEGLRPGLTSDERERLKTLWIEPRLGLVEVSIATHATPGEAWRALTDPAALAAWMGNVTELRQGSPARLDFGDGDFFELEVRQLDPPRMVAYTWRFMGTGPVDTITWWITRREGPTSRNGCFITVGDREPERTYEGCVALGAGWSDFLDRLGRFLMTGEVSRYDWRSEIEVEIELPTTVGEGSRLLLDRPLETWCGPLAGHQPDGFHIAHVERPAPEAVRFRLIRHEWGPATVGRLLLIPRSGGTLLSVRHDGWRQLRLPEPEQRALRKRFAARWVAAARAAAFLAGAHHNEPVEPGDDASYAGE